MHIIFLAYVVISTKSSNKQIKLDAEGGFRWKCGGLIYLFVAYSGGIDVYSSFSPRRSRDGAVVRALASNRWARV